MLHEVGKKFSHIYSTYQYASVDKYYIFGRFLMSAFARAQFSPLCTDKESPSYMKSRSDLRSTFIVFTYSQRLNERSQHLIITSKYYVATKRQLLSTGYVAFLA